MIIYFDNNASTQVDPRVLARMLPLFTEQYANPSSSHRFGAAALLQVEDARRNVAELIGATAGEIIFTSGGTEAVNAAILGVVAAVPQKRHIVMTPVEHHAARDCAQHLAGQGYAITWLKVDRNGGVDMDELAEAITPQTALVVTMLANNETGVILPVEEITRIAHARGVPVFSDAVNALGKMEVSVDRLGADLLGLSSHKIHGPKGVGALYLRKGTLWRPLIRGGPQEKHRRGGTHNAPGIAGFGAACELLRAEGAALREHSRALRDRFEAGLKRNVGEVHIVGQSAPRVVNTSCVCFPNASAESTLMLLSEGGICASSGAACASGAVEPSPVLRAMGIDPQLARGQVRFSFSRFNTEHEVDKVLGLLPKVLEKVRSLSL